MYFLDHNFNGYELKLVVVFMHTVKNTLPNNNLGNSSC
jgi:hypothetical protein